MLQSLYKHIFLFICGFRDSFRISPIKRYVLTPHKNSSQIRKILGESFLHLFIYFILSISIVYMLSSTEWFQSFKQLNALTNILFIFLYYFCWLGPLYLATTVYTFFWFGDIANLAFEIERDFYRVKIVQAKQSIETLGANALKKIVFMIVYMLASMIGGAVLQLIPYFGKLGIIGLYSFYYSVFLFMLKWNYNPYILAYFEQQFSYFLGFGLLYSWFTNLFTGALNDGMYWLLFPIYIFNSTCTQPPNLKGITIESFQQLRQMLNGVNYARDNTSYDEHLRNLRDDQQYKKSCLKQGSIFKIVRKLTNYLNTVIGKFLIPQDSSSTPETTADLNSSSQ